MENKIQEKINSLEGDFKLVFFENNNISETILLCNRGNKKDKYSIFVLNKKDNLFIVDLDVDLKKAIEQFHKLINK